MYFVLNLIRISFFSSLGPSISFFILSVGVGQALPFPAPSDPSSVFSENSSSIDILCEKDQQESGDTSVNQGEARPALPANPVAFRGEEAGPYNQVPPIVPYPYQDDEIIGGDSVLSIQSRLLMKNYFPSYADTQLARYEAQDLFEVKVDIIKKMAVLDPTGDWMRWGARTLDNPRTDTGEPSLKQLYARLNDLNEHGVQSQTFDDLKLIIRAREGDGDENSST